MSYLGSVVVSGGRECGRREVHGRGGVGKPLCFGITTTTLCGAVSRGGRREEEGVRCAARFILLTVGSGESYGRIGGKLRGDVDHS